MSEAPPTPDRDEEILARLAEFDLTAAERVHGRLMAAEAAGEIAELGRTYQRIARSLRQTLALKARLKRERAQDETQPQAPGGAVAGKPGGVAVARRIRELHAGVTRAIWNEAENEIETECYEDALADLVTRECVTDNFCAETLDDHVARVCLALGLTAEAAETWRDLPDPPDDPPDPPP